jgi:peptidyl-prolyl cis-trans isomerase SurA
LVCLAAAGLPFPRQAFAAEVVDRIVAVVNDEVISLYELNQMTAPFIERIKSSRYPSETERQLMFEVRKKVLDQMIDQKLTDQELERQNISVNPQEIDKYIERLKQSNYITDEQFRASLAEQGYTLDEYRQEVKQQMLRVKLVNREVKSKIVITTEDIRSYYENHSEEFAGEKKYQLYNIFIRLEPGADSRDRREALALMNEIYDRLEAGEAVDDVLRAYRFSSPAVEGGELGYFESDELSETLRDRIVEMQSGQFTPIIEMPYGYQIVILTKILETPGKTLEQAAAEIENKLYNEIVNEKYELWLQALRDRSHIRIIN